MTVRIVPLVVGWLRVDRARFLPGGPSDEINAPAVCWLIDTPRIRILVDTGPGDPHAAHARGHDHYQRTPELALTRRLIHLDVDPHSIEIVLLTHLHWDHAGDNRALPNATFVVQPDELAFARDPTPEHRMTYDAHVPQPAPLEGVIHEQRPGDYELAPGVSVLSLPGHTPGSQALVVAVGADQFVVAGDTVPLLTTLGSPPIPSAIHTDEEQLRTSLDRLVELKAFVLPSHDPQLAAVDGMDITDRKDTVCEPSR